MSGPVLCALAKFVELAERCLWPTKPTFATEHAFAWNATAQIDWAVPAFLGHAT